MSNLAHITPTAMLKTQDLMNSIKQNSPVVYQILKRQMATKWEITTGMRFKTTDHTPVSKVEEQMISQIK